VREKDRIIQYSYEGEKLNGTLEIELLLDEKPSSTSEITFKTASGNYISRSYSCFHALQELRRQLEVKGIKLYCNGASKNVYPSGMMYDMGGFDIAYRLPDGWHANLQDVINIFEFDEDQFIECTVDEQEEYYEMWRRSSRKRRSDESL